jgi:hypothetical protein
MSNCKPNLPQTRCPLHKLQYLVGGHEDSMGITCAKRKLWRKHRVITWRPNGLIRSIREARGAA